MLEATAKRRSEGGYLFFLWATTLTAYRFTLSTYMADSCVRLQSYKLPPK